MSGYPYHVPHQEAALRSQCRRWLNGHRPARSMRESLAQLAQVPEADLPLDVYGEGEALQALEAEVATLLGKPRARFFHKGVAAQLAALRVWTDDRPGPVLMHPQSHLAVDEQDAYAQLLGLRAAMAGERDSPMRLADVQGQRRPALLVMELPLRRGGFRLPQWRELEAMIAWCRAIGVPAHLDGARLWEAAAHYDRPLAEIAALFDSVYVSFYKGLGGLAGCVLAGTPEFIDKVEPWQTRLAGNVYTVYPFVLSALHGLRTQLPRMADYRRRAQALARALAAVPGFTVAPDPPQVNAFQLHLPAASPEHLRAALLALARQEGFWLGARAAASPRAGCAMVEVVIGDAADDWQDDELVALLQRAAAQAAVPG